MLVFVLVCGERLPDVSVSVRLSGEARSFYSWVGANVAGL